jgi:hypothetical protein
MMLYSKQKVRRMNKIGKLPCLAGWHVALVCFFTAYGFSLKKKTFFLPSIYIVKSALRDELAFFLPRMRHKVVKKVIIN